MTGDRRPWYKGKGCGCALVLVALYMGCAISLQMYQEHYLPRKLLPSPDMYQDASREMAIFCQSVNREIRIIEAWGSKWTPDSLVGKIQPNVGKLSPTEARFSFGPPAPGDYGYSLRMDHDSSTTETSTWNLYYYRLVRGETKEEHLYTLTIGRDENADLSRRKNRRLVTFGRQTQD